MYSIDGPTTSVLSNINGNKEIRKGYVERDQQVKEDRKTAC